MGQAEEWTLLEPGMTAWHAFYFSQPHAMRTGETADAGTTTVRMESVPKEVGKFEVLSQKEVDSVGQGGEVCSHWPGHALLRLQGGRFAP